MLPAHIITEIREREARRQKEQRPHQLLNYLNPRYLNFRVLSPPQNVE